MANTVRKTADRLIFPDNSEQSSAGIISRPPSGKYKVTGVHVDNDTGELVIEYSETPSP